VLGGGVTLAVFTGLLRALAAALFIRRDACCGAASPALCAGGDGRAGLTPMG
jgi:hypothetical protein